MTSDGFVVRGADAAEFLVEKLAILGLNARESEEFIIYWLPKLQGNEYNYIRYYRKSSLYYAYQRVHNIIRDHWLQSFPPHCLHYGDIQVSMCPITLYRTHTIPCRISS